MQSPEYTSYLGDPAGHAALVLAVAELEAPPGRILAGADAVMYGMQAAEHRSISDGQWKVLGSLPPSGKTTAGSLQGGLHLPQSRDSAR